MAFSLPFPTPPPNRTGVSAEASAEGLISRSLFTTKKSARLSPNGRSLPPAPLPLPRTLLPLEPGPEMDARGNQARADQNGNLWDLKRVRGVRWRGPGGPNVSLFSWCTVGTADR